MLKAACGRLSSDCLRLCFVDGMSEVQPAQTLEQALQDVANEDTVGITSETQQTLHTDSSDTDDATHVTPFYPILRSYQAFIF